MRDSGRKEPSMVKESIKEEMENGNLDTGKTVEGFNDN